MSLGAVLGDDVDVDKVTSVDITLARRRKDVLDKLESLLAGAGEHPNNNGEKACGVQNRCDGEGDGDVRGGLDRRQGKLTVRRWASCRCSCTRRGCRGRARSVPGRCPRQYT